ncbi:MAG: hypothetical protein IT378_07990 [Sandaracinaceae bacterium]|nr:hypothetical protein [Sandaracinaceae bacterium]
MRVERALEGARVTVDGRPLAPAQLGSAVPSDPGVRVARLVRGSDELDLREVDVPEGGGAEVSLGLPAGGPRGQPARGDVTGEWWLWALIGALVVGAGAAIVSGVALATPGGASGDFSPPILVLP